MSAPTSILASGRADELPPAANTFENQYKESCDDTKSR